MTTLKITTLKDAQHQIKIKHLIKILQAYIDGKPIQWRRKGSDGWYDVLNTPNNFDIFEYRIKPSIKIRPYKNNNEFLSDLKEHGPLIECKFKGGEWDDDNKKCLYSVTSIHHKCITLGPLKTMILSELYNHSIYDFRWQDGHICGVEENYE